MNPFLFELKYYVRKVGGAATRTCAIVLWIVLVSSLAAPAIYGKEAPSKGDTVRSSLVGLRLEKVHLYVDTDYKHHDVIRNRILHNLNKSGLKLNMEYPHWPFKQGQAILHLTIRSEPLHEEASVQVLYNRKLELFEYVTPERTQQIKVWAATWSYGIPDPVLTDSTPLERLEKDADDLLDAFIQDFLYANKKR